MLLIYKCIAIKSCFYRTVIHKFPELQHRLNMHFSACLNFVTQHSDAPIHNCRGAFPSRAITNIYNIHEDLKLYVLKLNPFYLVV